jgi:hypothetical protein
MATYQPKKQLQYPFDKAMEIGASIDFRVKPGAPDHKWLAKRGCTIRMAQDCTCYAIGPDGKIVKNFYPSSYGDWGTVDCDTPEDPAWQYFLQMYDEELLTPFRLRLYINRSSYDYKVAEQAWTTYNKEKQCWEPCPDPIENKA